MLPDTYTIPLIQLASGDRLSLQVYRFVGADPGKKVYIQANLHGAEIAGNAVIYQLMDFLKTLQNTELVGEVWLVPVCNPLGVNQRSHRFASGRYCVYEGKDWNRIFWDYEKTQEDLQEFAKTQINLDKDIIRINYLNKILNSFAKLAEKIHSPSSVTFTELFRHRLQSLSIDADYLIDLHTSTDRGLDYLYYFSRREPSAQYFLFDYGILLDDYDGDAFDEAFIKPWLALENTFQQLGREIIFDVEAWTLELGSGMQMLPQSVEKGVQGVKNYLLHKGVLATPKTKAIPQKMTFKLKSQIIKYYAPAGGMIQARVTLGSVVKAGEKLYQILMFNKTGELPYVIDICAEKDGLVYDVATNHAVNEGEYVLAVM
ncbi:succinylglutamate desuccinylase/aspartoacylase family protein [Gloeocapsopsis dulcis]|uniref:Succinylglutamate desuccinylase n=1 Tax=Gloeocapsopsis dulcis AAB1 = 1H9 TaxID=1433147 RepID=A0A6N8FQM6_9CHRO|nr:succinylglutamate desuccinylase/aspartoacylase family protein [Gloeocapsopsis dulcis]MUL35483.1 succinylglutamate desuccinylase [Gloeocapsopsis dulcis AAB1 = 1H9]WNN90323.1 succinylglutamate desuccinylase/aspartoacylase family protein [Gloeocapsopsis dulcis]